MRKFGLLFLLLITAACGARIPSPETAQSMTQSYFRSYGNKYKTSIIGMNPVEKVEINRIQEVSKDRALIDAFLNLQGGQVARIFITAKRSLPLGWSVQSWELLEQR